MFYIKPQHCETRRIVDVGCILFVFYIKPQHWWTRYCSYLCCILFVFYIKPQSSVRLFMTHVVVSYSCSTSNHNCNTPQKAQSPVVSYSCSTSNHNLVMSLLMFIMLYLIRVLHQTTTKLRIKDIINRLYLIRVLHQTTTLTASIYLEIRLYLIRVLHQTTTKTFNQ